MAGDWFPLQLWRSKCPEIVRVSSATGRTRHEVLGLLCDFWSWVSSETETGKVPGVYVRNLPDLVGADAAFWGAVAAVGWLSETATGIDVPGWEIWLSESAKKRTKDARRKRLARSETRPGVASAKRPRSVRKTSAQNRTTGQDRTGEREEEDVTTSSSCPEPAGPASGPPAVAEPPVLTFPVVGTDGREWPLTAAKAAEYARTFPGLDVPAELRKARQWCLDNPTRRKTAGGMAKFLGGWLGRAQDRGGGRSAGPRTKAEIVDGYAFDILHNTGDLGNDPRGTF